MFKKFSNRQKLIAGLVAGIVVIILYTLIYYLPNKFVVDKAGLDYTDSLPDSLITPQKLIYGFVHDSVNVEYNKVRNGDNFGSLLNRFNLSNIQIEDASVKSQKLFDLRKIRVGNRWATITPKSGSLKATHFVYEIDYTRYLVVNIGDSVTATMGQKEVERMHKISTGVITSSLWNAMKENKTSPLLAVDLSEIFAWTVDFFGIEKGDSYKVVYEEDYVDGMSIGISNVSAAYFKHKGHDYFAFKFAENGQDFSYFDEAGKSLKKAFLKAPLKFSRISSKFSGSRFHPVLKIFRPHYGVDYAAPIGTPVFAIGDGTVLAKGYEGGGGNYIRIRHNSVYTTVYMHLSKFEGGLTAGKFVRQGEVIGYVGKTGLATGPHLDFRVYMNGSPINPLSIESPSVEPIKPENMDRYKNAILSSKQVLMSDTIK